MTTPGLGRRVPTDDKHLRLYPLRAVQPETVAVAERTLPLPYAYRPKYDQGAEGACVGFGSSWMMSILNRQFYDAEWLYKQAQLVDEWADTPPAEGTSVRAGMDVLRTQGHRRIYRGKDGAPDPANGIAANRWASAVDEIRTCLAGGVPVVFGVNWYAAFDRPQQVGRDYWIGKDGNLGAIRGGHCICAYAVSDRRQAVKWVNSWGKAYPPVWVPYSVIQRLLGEQGEATVVTDR